MGEHISHALISYHVATVHCCCMCFLCTSQLCKHFAIGICFLVHDYETSNLSDYLTEHVTPLFRMDMIVDPKIDGLCKNEV